MQPTICPFCKSVLPAGAVFCPTCGRNIKEATQPIGLGKQIGVYLVSLILPPLGLIPGLKYFFDKNPNGKTVGIIAIFLTVIGTFITVYFFMQFMEKVNSQFQPVLDQYERLGY